VAVLNDTIEEKIIEAHDKWN